MDPLLRLSYKVIKLVEKLLNLGKNSQKIEENIPNRRNRWKIDKIDNKSIKSEKINTIDKKSIKLIKNQ